MEDDSQEEQRCQKSPEVKLDDGSKDVVLNVTLVKVKVRHSE